MNNISNSKSNLIERVFEETMFTDHKIVTEELSKAILKKYKINVPEFVLVNSSDEAVSVAKKLGFPLVMKVVSPQILHKTDVGGIKIGIDNVTDIKKHLLTCIVVYQRKKA